MATEKFQQSVSTFLALLPISFNITIMAFLPLEWRGLDTFQGNSSRALSCHFKTQILDLTESVVQLRIADCTLQLDQHIRSLSQTAGLEKGNLFSQLYNLVLELHSKPGRSMSQATQSTTFLL